MANVAAAWAINAYQAYQKRLQGYQNSILLPAYSSRGKPYQSGYYNATSGAYLSNSAYSAQKLEGKTPSTYKMPYRRRNYTNRRRNYRRRRPNYRARRNYSRVARGTTYPRVAPPVTKYKDFDYGASIPFPDSNLVQLLESGFDQMLPDQGGAMQERIGRKIYITQMIVSATVDIPREAAQSMALQFDVWLFKANTTPSVGAFYKMDPGGVAVDNTAWGSYRNLDQTSQIRLLGQQKNVITTGGNYTSTAGTQGVFPVHIVMNFKKPIPIYFNADTGRDCIHRVAVLAGVLGAENSTIAQRPNISDIRTRIRYLD